MNHIGLPVIQPRAQHDETATELGLAHQHMASQVFLEKHGWPASILHATALRATRNPEWPRSWLALLWDGQACGPVVQKALVLTGKGLIMVPHGTSRRIGNCCVWVWSYYRFPSMVGWSQQLLGHFARMSTDAHGLKTWTNE